MTKLWPTGLCLLLALVSFVIFYSLSRSDDLYRPALKEAAITFTDSLSLESDFDKIAVTKLDGDKQGFFHEVLLEALAKKPLIIKDIRLQVMGKTALDRIPRPPTHDGFINKLIQEYKVKALLNGALTDCSLSFGRASVTVNLTLYRLPGQETIHSVTNLKGTTVLPPLLFILFWIPALLVLLSFILAGKYILSLLEANAVKSEFKTMSSGKELDTSTELLPKPTIETYVDTPPHNTFEKLISTIKEVVVLISDIIVLSKQNKFAMMSNFSENLGRFLRDEIERISSGNYTRAEIREQLELTDDDVNAIVQTDLEITDSLNTMQATLKQVLKDFQKQKLELDHIEKLNDILHIKGDIIRDKFRERTELFNEED